jgi:predicted RNase H-like HicB family nuclease
MVLAFLGRHSNGVLYGQDANTHDLWVSTNHENAQTPFYAKTQRLGPELSDKGVQGHERENAMKINIVYQEKNGWFVGHIQEYPDYVSQGETLEEFRDNLIEIYEDIRKGLAPDAEPFRILEAAL